MCSPRKSNENFSIFTFNESKQMSLTQDLRWSLGRSIALQLQRQTDLLLCTINCFLQWDHLPNMAVGDLAFYYTLYLCPTLSPGGGYSTLAWMGGVPPGPRDPNPCLEVKKVPMFRDFAQKMDPCFRGFLKIFMWFWRKMDPCLGIWGSKMGPMFRDFLSKTDPFGRHIPV